MTGRPSALVLGPSPAWPNPGEACSGTLVTAGGARFLVDCGPGVLAALLVRDPGPLDAIVLTHAHLDHVADLVGLGYGIKYGPLASFGRPALHVPPGADDLLAALCVAGGGQLDHLRTAFELATYDPDGALAIGQARLTFARMPHPGVSHAIRIEADGGALVFSGDTEPNAALAPHARGAGALICEATLGAGEPEPGGGHMTAHEAGRVAAEAGVGRLVLNHLDVGLREAAVAAARSAYDGPVEAAVPGLRIAV